MTTAVLQNGLLKLTERTDILLAVLLVGDAPHARVYVPEALRAQVRVGGAATVRVGADGARQFPGRVRMVRSEPVFTPYFALSGKDASRLSFLAEVQLEG